MTHCAQAETSAEAVRYEDHLDSAALARRPALAAFARRLGGTTLLELPQEPGCARIVAKCEWENPSGTVKDRVAFAMLYRLLSRRADAPRVLEYSGGTLAVSLAGLCRALDLPLTVVVSSGTSAEALAQLERDGAGVELVAKEKGFYAVMERAFALSQAHPDWAFLYQHKNPANLWIHRCTTGREVVAQHARLFPGGRIDAWIASIGTGGSLIGAYDAIRAAHPGARLYGVTPAELPYASPLEPNGLPKFAGSGGLGCGRRQPFVEARDADVTSHFTYTFEDSLRELRRLTSVTGLRIGSSAAANLLAAREVARRVGPGGCVATIFPSAATPDEWRQAQALS